MFVRVVANGDIYSANSSETSVCLFLRFPVMGIIPAVVLLWSKEERRDIFGAWGWNKEAEGERES